VLPARDGLLVRPLVRAARADVLAYVARHGIAVAADPSNADPRFVRARVRHEVLPLLGALSPRIVASLCDLADDLAPIRDAPDPLASLNRAQRQAIARARARGRTTARLRMTGGRDVLATFGVISPRGALPEGGDVRMEDVAPAGRRRRGGR
jgi:tRNA(Ile)-lysidine synthase